MCSMPARSSSGDGGGPASTVASAPASRGGSRVRRRGGPASPPSADCSGFDPQPTATSPPIQTSASRREMKRRIDETSKSLPHGGSAEAQGGRRPALRQARRARCAPGASCYASRVRILPATPDGPDARANVAEGAARLRAGLLVAFPTETVYGLGARALDAAAVERVFAAKGRPKGHPLIVHVRSEDEARGLASTWSDRASRLARAFWPGPLTIVVPRAAHVPDAVTGGLATVAVRAPAHAVALALLAALGEPIVAPSANRFQRLSPTRAEHVARSLEGADVLVLDGGPCERGLESTVVDVSGERPKVLRLGPIGRAAVEEAWASASRSPPPPCPRTRRARRQGWTRATMRRARACSSPTDEAQAERLEREWSAGAEVPALAPPGGIRRPRPAPSTPSSTRSTIGAWTPVIVVLPPDGEAWGAVRDRLLRAATPDPSRLNPDAPDR